MKKITTLLLCLLLTAMLCACQNAKAPVTEAPTTIPTEAPTETTAATEAPTTVATEPAIDTEDALNEALTTTGIATLTGDIALTREVIVQNGFLDGNGFAITGPVYVDGQPETENAITVMGGTVQNVSVSGAYRSIGDSSENRVCNDVRLNHVQVDSQVYVLNFGYGSGQTNLYVENSVLLGWTSYTKFQEAIFTDCTFGWDSTGANGNLRPYINTTLIGCKFEGKTEEDGTVVPFNIKFKSGSDGVLLVLEDCYVGDTLITQENAATLLALDLQGNILQVRNSN